MSRYSFQDVYNHVWGFVIQLNMNGTTHTSPLGPTGIRWHSERTDGLSPLSPCSDPPALDTNTDHIFIAKHGKKLASLEPCSIIPLLELSTTGSFRERCQVWTYFQGLPKLNAWQTSRGESDINCLAEPKEALKLALQLWSVDKRHPTVIKGYPGE